MAELLAHIDRNIQTYSEAFNKYSGRDKSEKLFRSGKSFLGGDAMRVHSESSLAFKTFINFLALIVRNKMYRLIKDEVYETLNAGNHMNVCKAFKKLDKIELTRRGKGVYTLDCSLSKNRKEILKTFNMGEGDVTMTATKLQEILSKL